MRGTLAALTAFTALLFAPAAHADVLGQLSQLGGTAGCLTPTGASEVGAGDCTDLRSGTSISSVVVSPDGRSVYADARTPGELLVLRRDPSTGALTQLSGVEGCISQDGSGEAGAGSCINGRAIQAGDGRGIAVSRDGRFVYAAAENENGVAIFARDGATGALTQLAGVDGCITADGSSEDGAGTCANGRALSDAQHILITPDQRHVVVGAYGEAGFAIFARDGGTGKMTQLPGVTGCVTEDGASNDDGAGTCIDGLAVDDGDGYYMSPDGRHLYVTGYGEGSLTVFSRDSASGAVTQLAGRDGCITPAGDAEGQVGVCTDGHAVAGAWTLAGSPGGEHLYLGAYDAEGVAIFRRDGGSGKLTQLAGTDGCVTADGSGEGVPGTCTDGRGIGEIFHPAVSADGRNVYFTNRDANSIAAFARDGASGRLTHLDGALGCLSTTGAGGTGEPVGTCTDARALEGAYSAAISPDDGFLYTASEAAPSGLAVFRRQASPACTDTTATVAHGGTVTIDLPCRDANGDQFGRSIVSEPGGGTLGTVDQGAGRVTYTARAGFTGTDTFTYRAADVTSAGNIATARVEVGPAPPVAVPLPPPVRPRDTTRPRCTLTRNGARAAQLRLAGTTRVRDLLRGRLPVRVRCSEAARLSGTLTVARSRARALRLTRARGGSRPITVGRGTGRALSGNRASTLNVRLSRTIRSRLRRAGSRRLRATRMTLTLVAVDAVGNRSTVRRVVRISR